MSENTKITSMLNTAPYSLNEWEISGSARTASKYIPQANDPSTFSADGHIKIERAGTYQFLLESDDGSNASIGSGNIDNGGEHALRPAVGSFDLQPGFYPVSVSQFDIGATLQEDGTYTKNSCAIYFKWDGGGGGSPGGSYHPTDTTESTPSGWPLVPFYDIQPRQTAGLTTDTAELYVGPVNVGEEVPPQSGTVSIFGNTTARNIVSSDSGVLEVDSGSGTTRGMHAVALPEGVNEQVVTLTLKDSQGDELASCDVKVIRNKCKPEDECECIDCGEGTEADAGCISFGLAFGQSPHLKGAPSGQLMIEEDRPSAGIYTPAILHYRHPLTRKIASAENDVVIVSDGTGNDVAYHLGSTFGNSSGIQAEIMQTSGGQYCETLPDRTRVYYDSNGNFDHLVTSDGVEGNLNNLGIDLILANGNIRQIWAATEGLLDITSDAVTSSFVISWYKNSQVTGKDSVTGLYTFSGSPVKTFTFEKPSGETGNNSLHMTERRGNEFEFHYEWTYVNANSDWTIHRGDGTTYVTKVKSRSAGTGNGNSDNRTILSYVTTGSDSGTLTTTETLSTTLQGNRVVGRTVNGVTYMDGTRDAGAGGRLAESTDRSGRTTGYEYDVFGRVTKVTAPGLGGLLEITKYEYPGASVDGRLDLRPAKVTEQLKNETTSIITTLSVTEYEYGNDTAAGRTETIVQTVKGVSQTTERCWWPVPVSTSADPVIRTVGAGRLMSELRPDGTMTFYEYSATSAELLDITNYSTFSYTETITEGIRSNVIADHYFGIVAYKSTRRINTYDAAGNIVRSENYIHCNGAFRLVSWEEHVYNPMHKVTSSEYSNGKTSSADWICTGPVFEIDTDGIRTDYTYDALKRCTSKVRRSPNGDVATDYTYDSEGRILSTTVSGGTGAAFVSETTSQTYDLEGRIASRTDARGLVTTYSYSLDNLTTTETRPNGGTVITARNLDGTTASVTGTAVTPVYYIYSLDAEDGFEITEERYGSPASERWRKTFTNKFGQVVRIQESAWDESVRTTVNTYNGKGQLTTTASTGAPTLAYLYDNMGNLSQETVADGETERIVTRAFQHVGYATTQWAARQLNTSKCSDTAIPANSTYLFTQLSGFTNALEQKTDAKNVRSLSTLDWSTFDPDTKIRTIRHTEPGASNGTTQLVRDGLTLSQTDAAGVTTTFTYDALGRQLTATDGRGNATTNVYNSIGQLVSVTDAADNTTAYAYSPTTGELLAITDANGKTVNYVYDLRGRKIAEYGTAAYPVTFEYNIFGEMVTLFTYRSPDAVIVTNPDPLDGDQTVWSYDESSGLLASKTYADDKTVSYTYDVNGVNGTKNGQDSRRNPGKG